MRANQFYFSLCLSVLLTAIGSVHVYAQTGKNLPIWAIGAKGTKTHLVDWRANPPVVSPFPNSPISNASPSAVAIDECGKLAFYVLPTSNVLHIYSPDGTRLTTTAFGTKMGLHAIKPIQEIQVVRVPGKADEWFIIYNVGGWCSQVAYGFMIDGAGCPVKVAYTWVKYNETDGLVMSSDRRDIPLNAPTGYLLQGKAVSTTVNGDNSRRYLYLVETNMSQLNPSGTTFRLWRYIIDELGINFPTRSSSDILANQWFDVGSSAIALSPDQSKLVIINKNTSPFAFYYKQDIIIFDLNKFNVTGYAAEAIAVPNLKVYGPGKSMLEIWNEIPCVSSLRSGLEGVEFSPSGRYLYVTHGGQPFGWQYSGDGALYNTYLLQIDLHSGTGNGDYTTRMQIEKGGYEGCGVLTINTNIAVNHISAIQKAYDGKLYFTKKNSSKLFVIPNPDDPMPHSLVPGVVDLSTPTSPNVIIPNATDVRFLPDNIDGLDYPKLQSAQATFTTTLNGDDVSLTIISFNSSNTYQVSWGDGMQELLTSASGQQHTYAKSGNYTIELTIRTPDQCVSAYSKPIKVLGCLAMSTLSITNSQYLCATKFSVNKFDDCYATYQWGFGDGTTSLERSPMHVYAPGTYTVTAKINYSCDICRNEIVVTKQVTIGSSSPVFEEKVLQIPSDQRTNILSSAATTFSERWPVDHNEPALENMNGFVSGAQGLWRNEGTFVYNTPRTASASVNLRTDGTYTLDHFNWANASLEAVPKWIKANTMTRFNAYGFELENKDVLNVYSAALYDYSGQMQSAHGVNMRNEEMGFSGFECYENVGGTNRFTKPTGNFMFYNQAVPTHRYYNANAGNSHIAVIEATVAELQDADRADIIVNGYTGLSPSFAMHSRYLQNVKILCKQSHTNPAWSIVVFERAPYAEVWTGQIRIKNTILPTTGDVETTFAHTGTGSLKIATEKIFEQRLIRLEAGKVYHFSAWVATDAVSPITPKLANNLGVDVILKNKQGVTIASNLMAPEGAVIERWQLIKGSFTCPEKDLILSLRFKPGGTGVAWYDDVRLYPENGNMKSYVYDVADYRLRAILDENNFASIFYYDKEGNLYLTKKETEEGVKTISENISYQIER